MVPRCVGGKLTPLPRRPRRICDRCVGSQLTPSIENPATVLTLDQPAPCLQTQLLDKFSLSQLEVDGAAAALPPMPPIRCVWIFWDANMASTWYSERCLFVTVSAAPERVTVSAAAAPFGIELGRMSLTLTREACARTRQAREQGADVAVLLRLSDTEENAAMTVGPRTHSMSSCIVRSTLDGARQGLRKQAPCL
jgi:hypothetical protein